MVDAESEHKQEARKQKRLKTQKAQADLVDEIERGLSRALQDYRHHAEEVLARHLLDLEASEAQHELEVSQLRAENSKLRDALGLKVPTELFQTVLFQQAEESKETSVSPRRRHSMARNISERDDSEMLLNSRRKQAQHPAGAWQSFVAWVPNGAALKTAEPWKPLPPELQLPNSPRGEQLQLPGMIQVDPAEATLHHSRKSAGGTPKDHCDDSDSDSNVDDREPFEVLEAWRASLRQLERLRRHDVSVEHESRYTSSTGNSSGMIDDSMDEDYTSEARFCLIIHPHSNKRVLWDIGSLLMVVYDMIMIPMSAFSLPSDNFFLDFMDWTTRLFWTLDMGWSMLTAVVLPDGKINFSMRYILKRYVKTWFALDILIVSSDWMEVAVKSSNVLGLGRLARIFRIVRVVRLLRLVRMQEVMQAVTERVQSDKLSFVLSTSKLIIFVLVCSHIIACLWWAVGDSSSDGVTWVSKSTFASAGLGTQYLVALHWSVSQFTGGMDEIAPENPLERFFAVIAWTFAFVATAVICSILTSNLTHLHIIGGAQARQMAALRMFLKQNHVSSNLALQVQRSAQHHATGDLAADNVEMLSIVAEPLQVEMHFEIYSSALRNHPLFSDYVHGDPHVMRRVCHQAMSTVLLARGDVVFSKGETPRQPKMYFVVKGLLEYFHRGDVVTIGERQWVAEGALWTSWRHRGTFTATTDVKLAVLDSQSFQDVVHRFRTKTSFDPRLYASEYVKFLNDQKRVDDLTFMS